MLEPPPPKKIGRARAYSFNKKGELVLRPAPVPMKRPRTFSYRKTNGNFAKVSVKRGSKELTGQDRRTRIYELLYFIPTTVMKALTPKQLDQLLLAHQCAICQKVFRLSSGVKIHIKDQHENRTLLSFFKKTKKTEDANNNKENVKAQTLGKHTPEKDKNNQSVLVRKPSIKNYFNICKPPRYVAKPLGLTPLKCRSRQEIQKTNKNNSAERDDFTRLTPLLDNLRKSSTSEKEQNTKNGAKPKLMSGKTWTKKNLGLDSKSAEVLRDSVKQAVDGTGGEGVEHSTPQKDEQATPPPFSSNFTPPATPRRPKLMTPKNWRKRVEALTPEINKVEADVDAIQSPEIPELNTKVSSPVASMPARTYKPKLMTSKKWREKTNQVNANKPILDENLSTTDFNVKDKFDNESAEQNLLHKGALKVLKFLRVISFYSRQLSILSFKSFLVSNLVVDFHNQ